MVLSNLMLALILASPLEGGALEARIPEPTSSLDFWADEIVGRQATGQVRDTKGKPLSGVTIRIFQEDGLQEVLSGSRGLFLFEMPEQGKIQIELQLEGYESLRQEILLGKERPRLRFTLRSIGRAVVEVTGGLHAEVVPLLREDLIATEVVSPIEIRKTNAVSLNEAVDCKPGISVQTECSICNVRNVLLNNLPGRFTTILIDGVPIFSSVSGAYGLDMIGVNGVEAIEVSRGAGVSLIAPEALAGTVNLVSRRPEKTEGILELQGGDGGYRRLDAFYGKNFAGGAFTASFLGNQQLALDGNGNGVSEFSGYRRSLGGLALFLDDAAGFSLRGRLDVVDEKRGGGALGRDYEAIQSSRSGNPFDWSRGRGASPDSRGWIRPDGNFQAAEAESQHPIRLADGRVLLPYDLGRGGFSEIIQTNRLQGIVLAERPLGENLKLKLAAGAARHDQDSFYEGDIYKATQDQYYLESSLQAFLGQSLFTFGLNYRYEDLRSHGALADRRPVDGLDNYTYRTPAAFLQLYKPFFNGKLEFNGSLRYDRNNVFGGISTPRLNLLWHHNARMNSRFALGRGFRVPTSFFEQDHGILSTTRIERLIQRPETSDNASYTFSMGGSRTALVLSASYNRIQNYALLDSGALDPRTHEPITLFTQAQDPVTVKGLDGTFTFKLAAHRELTLGAEKYSYNFTPGVLAFARPEQRLYLRFDLEEGPFNIFTRATWTGSMDLKRFYNYEGNRRYNLDGSSKLERSPSYWTVDVNASWKLSSKGAVVVNLSNLFNFRQTDREDFLWVDAAGNYDVTHFWGPARGRAIQLGLRYSF